MGVREKLVEILKQAPFEGKVLDEWWWEEKIVRIVDHLIAHGVTVQEWIPVTERLPELHTKVLCCGVKGGRFIAETSEWGEGHLYWTKKDGKGCSEVTHWMPLPQPPKGE
jgi:hypothetical protein